MSVNVVKPRNIVKGHFSIFVYIQLVVSGFDPAESCFVWGFSKSSNQLFKINVPWAISVEVSEKHLKFFLIQEYVEILKSIQQLGFLDAFRLIVVKFSERMYEATDSHSALCS